MSFKQPAPAASPAREMIVVPEIDAVRLHVAAARKAGKRVGVVPTMGALHAGHIGLVEAARGECDFVAVTIFVNPTQFGPNEDLAKYPRTLDSDLAMCRAAGVDLVFTPPAEAIYASGFGTFVEVEGLSGMLEGKHRPGHFRGVATVVLKLFNIVRPDVAYFGLKDYQQQLVIRQMCRDLDLPVEIRSCPTVREPDGLAMSSRNRFLSPDERERSLALSRGLRRAKQRIEAGERDVAAVRRELHEQLASAPGVVVDYATIADADTLEELTSPRPRMVALVAARVGGTRLIDNVLIETPQVATRGLQAHL